MGIAVREEAEPQELELARSESVRDALQALGTTLAKGCRVRCLAGGMGPRGSRRADLRVLQRLRLPAPLEFDRGSHMLQRSCRPAIHGIARTLQASPALRVCLEGCKDENEAPGLALMRAETVRDRLLQRSVD